MLSNIPLKDECPQIVEVIFDKTKIPTFIACGEQPEFPKRSLPTVVDLSGMSASDVFPYYTSARNLR